MASVMSPNPAFASAPGYSFSGVANVAAAGNKEHSFNP